MDIIRGWIPKEWNPSAAWTTSIDERTLYHKKPWTEKRKEQHQKIINAIKKLEIQSQPQALFIKMFRK